MSWWVSLLISLALRSGLPWLVKKIPWIPKEVLEIVLEAISQIEASKKSYRETAKEKRAKARALAHAACTGVGCPSDLK